MRIFFNYVAALCLCASSFAAQALTVFACEPEWAALVRTLAPHAQVFVATHHQQDPHHVEARPSLIAQLRQADMLVCTGAELEAGWLPMLQDRAGNPKVQDGEIGVFYATDSVKLIDKKAKGNVIGAAFAGDVHAHGNPHVHTDPARLLHVAADLSRDLQKIDASHAPAITKNAEQFVSVWKGHIARWQKQAAPLRGKKVAAQHGTFAYLFNWLGLQQVADLEPKPGMPPTAAHLQSLKTGLQNNKPDLIVHASYQNPKPAQWLATQLGMHAIKLPATVAQPDAGLPALVAWYDDMLSNLNQKP